MISENRSAYSGSPIPNRSWRWGLGSALCSLVVVGCIWTAWPRECLLLSRATPVTTGYNWKYGYTWLTNSRFLATQTVQVGPIDEEVKILSLEQYDTTNKKSTALEAANARLDRLVQFDPSWGLSPDKQWLMLHGWKGTDIMRLDGTGYRHFDDDGRRCIPYWMADSRRWLDVYYWPYGTDPFYEMVLYDRDGPAEGWKLPISNDDPLYNFSEVFASAAAGEELIQFQEDEDIPQNSGVIVRRRLGRSTDLPAEHHFRFPEPGKPVTAAFDPHCRRIALLLSTQRPPSPFRVWLHRVVPKIQAPPTPLLRLWVSGLDGHSWQEIGQIKDTSSDMEGFPLSGLNWLPDGKRLSFIYKNTLYTVPVHE